MLSRPVGLLVRRKWYNIVRMRAERRWVFSIFSVCIACLFLLLTVILGNVESASFNLYRIVSSTSGGVRPGPRTVLKGPGFPPVLAYWIYGSKGDKNRIFRLLKAVYHPRNRYLLHLDSAATLWEKEALAASVRSVRAFRVFGNVDVAGKSDAVNYVGSSALAAVLHAAALFLRIDGGWDWFVTLSASDYPVVTQDDLLHAFSSLSRELNFIDHTSDLGWKEYQRANPIIVDPAIYLTRKPSIFYATQKQPNPESFRFFTGSPWVMLSRSFIKFCTLGWDNLPRTLLLYFANVVVSEEGYFHSVICNSPEYQNTTVNTDLRYLVWDTPPRPHPRNLNATDFDGMVESGAAFARQFLQDEPILKMVDDYILKRRPFGVVPGGWCLGEVDGLFDPCAKWGDINVLKLGLQGRRLSKLISKAMANGTWQSSQCK